MLGHQRVRASFNCWRRNKITWCRNIDSCLEPQTETNGSNMAIKIHSGCSMRQTDALIMRDTLLKLGRTVAPKVAIAGAEQSSWSVHLSGWAPFITPRTASRTSNCKTTKYPGHSCIFIAFSGPVPTRNFLKRKWLRVSVGRSPSKSSRLRRARTPRIFVSFCHLS